MNSWALSYKFSENDKKKQFNHILRFAHVFLNCDRIKKH